jgi:hypothetical protein
MQELKTACSRLPDGPDYRKLKDDYVENLMLTVLDFQMRAESTVNNSLNHFTKNHPKIDTDVALANLIKQFEDTEAGNRALAKSLWGNNHWTRANFLRVILNDFRERGVSDQKSLYGG